MYQWNSPLAMLFCVGLIVFVWSCILWILMYLHANKMHNTNKKFADNDADEESKSWFLRTPLGIPFAPFAETARTPWNILEQRYYAQDKESIEEELRLWKAAQVDISLMETRLRSMAAALEIEKDQRCALEDRMQAKVRQTSQRLLSKFEQPSLER